MSSYKIYTDGSARPGGPASCACIVEDEAGRIVAKLCAYLPEMSPLQAEILGGALGFDYLTTLVGPDNDRNPINVNWHCDSLAVVRAAGAQAVDAIFTEILGTAMSSFQLTISHVRAHAGDPRNEACDRACRWVRLRGGTLLERHGEGEIGLGKGLLRWVLRDARQKCAPGMLAQALTWLKQASGS